MNGNLEELADWGCDIVGAKERFMDDMDLYRMCLSTVINDPAYEKLGEALKNQNKTEAFEQAHTLKGVLANMRLIPIYDIAVRIVESLRNDTGEDLWPVYEELLAANETLKNILKG